MALFHKVNDPALKSLGLVKSLTTLRDQDQYTLWSFDDGQYCKTYIQCHCFTKMPGGMSRENVIRCDRDFLADMPPQTVRCIGIPGHEMNSSDSNTFIGRACHSFDRVTDNHLDHIYQISVRELALEHAQFACHFNTKSAAPSLSHHGNANTTKQSTCEFLHYTPLWTQGSAQGAAPSSRENLIWRRSYTYLLHPRHAVTLANP